MPDAERLLWIKTELLHPIDKGGKIRTFEMLKRLKTRHYITYLALDDGTVGPQERAQASEYCHELVCIPFSPAPRGSARFYAEALVSALSPLPYAISRYRSAAMRAMVTERAPTCDVVVSDFLVSAVNLPERLPRPTLLFQHNVEAEIWRRHAQNRRNLASKIFFEGQWRRMEAFERQACRASDSVVAVSEDDCVLMRQRYELDHVQAVATGVDTDYFRPSGTRNVQPRTLVFTGSMDWMPNDDAVRWFVTEIMPLIEARIFDLRLVVVGRNPSSALVELANRRGNVVVTGRVADVRPYVEEAHCFVVPVRIGGGTRLKIFEAMAMEKPVVSTTIGAEGLPIKPGFDILVSDGAEAFAASVVDVLQNDNLSTRLAVQAGRTVRERFGWETVARQFSAFCAQVTNNTNRR